MTGVLHLPVPALIAACPDNHLHCTFPGLGEAAARAVFLTVAVSLHALFLGVARL
jgi:hypothetical protein